MEKYEQFKQKLDIFSGYITQPDVKYFENGKCKCNFAIPLKKSKDDDTLWLNCEAWGSMAEKIGELKKGTEVLVFGYFKEDTFKDKEGKEKTKTVFITKGVI